MSWELALYALIFVFLVTAALALVGGGVGPSEERPLESYLLASGTLGPVSVVNLLLSSSFGLNAVFYQVWLGYSVGFWGLVTQAAWAISFPLLSIYVPRIREGKSLHDFIGLRFGHLSRLVAGLCSLLGIMYLMGWEVSIGRSTISGLLALDNALSESQANLAAQWLAWGVVVGCLAYTILGGLRSNAAANLSQNVLKIGALFIIAIMLGVVFARSTATPFSTFWDKMFPSLDTMVENLGWLGLITNIVFSLCWQFVDTSTWQNVIGSSKATVEDSRWNLQASGIVVLLTPGILGTAIGVFLTVASGVDPSNVLVKAFTALNHGSVLLFLVFVIIMASVMSLIDGLFLASAYTLVVDITHPKTRLGELDGDVTHARRLLTVTRGALFVVAVLAIWGTQSLVDWIGGTLFDFLYVVIIPQLALIGAVLAALWNRERTKCSMAGVILGSVIIGFLSIFAGTQWKEQWLVDGAGTITVFFSFIAAMACSRKKVATLGVAMGGGK